jgi:hypothetical protein
VIARAIDGVGNAADVANGATQPGVKAIFPSGLDEVAAFLRAPDHVIPKAGVG